ncbi:MAG: carbonic anhydrase [Armatimonadetes bacterium]|nr:carbonic anhydrase [Armatimonadota bacterium]
MDSHLRLLEANKVWVAEKLGADPDFFQRLVDGQQPEYLWIGCADSRVPAEEITGTMPGELFVHRNIANQVIHTDFNMLSVLQYAVEVLKVKHVIVCGHYGCGGVMNALTNRNLGLINKWLRHIKDVYRIHRAELDAIEDEEARFRRLVEWNTIEQVTNLAETSIVQKSWAENGFPVLHGWVYDLGTGIIDELVTIKTPDVLEPIYRYDFEPGTLRR